MMTIDKVKASVARYATATDPVNIEDLIGAEALERFLVGCSSVLVVGIATYYIKDGDVSGGFRNLMRRSSLTDMAGLTGSELFHPICLQYRMDREGNGRCLMCDKEVAMKFYTGTWKGCKLYRCHLNMIDMTYPLMLNGKVLGVLFGGQIVLKRDETNWREGLREIADSIIWDMKTDSTEIPERVCQISDVCKALKTEVPGGSKAARELIRFARDNAKDKKNKAYYLTMEGLVARFKLLREFGKMIEELLVEMYEAKKQAASEGLLRAVGDYLAEGDVTDQNRWREHCRKLLEVLGNGHSWCIYSRRGEEFFPCTTAAGEEATRIGTRELAGVEVNRLVRFDDSDTAYRAIFDCLALRSGEAYGYLSRPPHAGADVSTLIIVSGPLEKLDREMAESLSRSIALAFNRAQLALPRQS
jgi:ligand-binding sensor protein